MNAAPAVQPMDILLVEDSPTDVLLTREALDAAPRPVRLNVAEDGQEALDYLHQRGAYAGTPRPDLIVLDLNLPRRDGREVLRDLKNDPELRVIPVIVLSTSTADEDIAHAYNLHANCYIAKPLDFSQFEAVVRSMREFWFTVVTLPPRRA
jgi:CheY-like chemotaxis protein